ncbi:MAG: class II fructose-bisphosphate aldolase [Tannerella sp.]|jgi:fructose-bisphosphate aldolase class II|nr:class II fructose-bisphosphate aldolase [Tannerella sp.]
MRIHEKDILSDAYGRYGVGAFNVFNAEQVLGVFRGAKKAEMPVIVQITPVARNYIQPELLEGIIAGAAQIYPDVTFSVHLDHGNEQHCLSAIDSGDYSSVMIDASHEPFEENVRITKNIVEKAHDKGIWVEAELGVLSGVEDHLKIDDDKALYTDPAQVEEFVGKTHCDSLAVAVGTSHGAYKFSGGRGLRLDILATIRDRLPAGYPLVLHGASAVPANEINRINQTGGQLKSEAKGVDPTELMAALRLGVCKINIATDMRLIWTRVTREFFHDHPDQFDPVISGKTYMDALEDFVDEKCRKLKIINS